MGGQIPVEVQSMLRQASSVTAARSFTCSVFGSPWDTFVETWCPRIHTFLGQALGPYGTEPLPDILPLEDGMHSAGATASFNLYSGQIRICTSVENKPGQTLEKLCHEMVHGSLAKFPEGDEFYEEGFVDYSTWVLAHAPVWGDLRDDMIKAAALNIQIRRDRALLDQSDYDRKRWAGGLFASMSRGPHIIATLRQRKMEGNLYW